MAWRSMSRSVDIIEADSGYCLGFFLDLGVALHGTPEVSAMADGPVALLPGFQDDLDQEVRNLQEDLDPFIVYPILSVGVSFRLGT